MRAARKILIGLLAAALFASLPLASLAASLADGDYRAELTLEGGTGRASVESPAQVTVENGTAVVQVVWSSPYYEFMLVDGVRYDPLGTIEGKSVFAIPLPLDQGQAVSAQTVAMSQPHLIDYTLTLHSETAKALDGAQGGQSSWVWWAVGGGAAVVLVLGLTMGRGRKERKERK